jgi:nitronate monooxygenase
VANEGGIGVISAAFPGMGEADISDNSHEVNIRALRDEIRKAKQMTSGILGVNIMVALTNFGEMAETSIEEGIDIIFAGAGLPMNLPGYLKNGSKTKLVPIVSSGRAARLICKKWLSSYDYLPDAFVVEGPEAGGHLGFTAEQLDDPAFALEGLVEDVIEAVKPFEQERNARIPVIAAGGIFTGRDIWKFLEMGAAGVQMGTRFVATYECDADDGFKQVYLDAKAEDMTVIKSPVGLPGRAVRNRFLTEVEKGTKKSFRCTFKCLITCDPEKSPYCIALALANARKGKFAYGFAFAGKNAYRIQEIISVKELMETLHTEYSEVT